MFNKKRIKKLEEIIKEKNQIIDNRDDVIEMMRKALKGEHVCSSYCSRCVNGVSAGFGYACTLDCRCNDFEDKNRPQVVEIHR